MDKMGIFSDTINESFGYREIEWKGNTYMVDFDSKDSVEKLLFLITGKSNLDDCLSSLINLSNQPEFLNKLISAISSKILVEITFKSNTQYSSQITLSFILLIPISVSSFFPQPHTKNKNNITIMSNFFILSSSH